MTSKENAARDTIPSLYTVSEARGKLGLGTTRFYELLKQGRLDARKLGSKTVITSESLAAYIENLPRY
jgi:excisionase family DNA binding protein